MTESIEKYLLQSVCNDLSPLYSTGSS